MSSRQLRKLQRQRELAAQQPATAEEAESSDESPIRPAKPNLFAGLAQDDDNDDDAKDDEDEDVAAVGDTSVGQPAETSSAPKKSKKKKKKKKAKKQDVAADPVDEPSKEQSEDEIDKALKSLNIRSSSAERSRTHGSQAHPERARLLRIDSSLLKPRHEMVKLFGTESMRIAEAEEQEERQAATRAQTRRGGAHRAVDLETFLKGNPTEKLPEITLRRNIFAHGRDHWPRSSVAGLALEKIAVHGFGTEYAFVYGKEYQQQQANFFARVLTGNPEIMIQFAKEHPYHVSTLVQTSLIAHRDQNASFAAELCERALFTFGRVTTSAFRQDLLDGTAKLNFARPENRQFWLAGYHYLKSLIRRGTFRTALEWAKLLFGIGLFKDREVDPYCMKQFIHTLAIQAQEAKWLLDFLQNMGESQSDWEYIWQTCVLARLQLKDVDGAKQDLRWGMSRLPWLYCSLFQSLGLDAPPSIWATQAKGGAEFYTKLYIHQTKDLWNNTQAISLLKEVAGSIEKPDPEKTAGNEVFSDSDLDMARYIFLEDKRDLIGHLSQHLVDVNPNYEFDPLPPAEEDNLFVHKFADLPWNEARRPFGDLFDRAADVDFLDQLRRLGIEVDERDLGLVQPGEEGAEFLDDDDVASDMDEEALRAEAGRGTGADEAERRSVFELLRDLVDFVRAGTASDELGDSDDELAAAELAAELAADELAADGGDAPSDTSSDEHVIPGAWPSNSQDANG